MQRWADFGILPLVFAGLGVLIGSVVTIALRRQRLEPIPRSWWLSMGSVCASPAIMCLGGIAFMPDRPRLHPTVLGMVAEDAGFLAVAIAPLVLLGATLYRVQKPGWLARTAIVLACLGQLPVAFASILAAGQLVAGVSL